jgi:hypothetical protein
MSHNGSPRFRSTISVAITIGLGGAPLAVAVTGQGLACVIAVATAAVLIPLMSQLPRYAFTLWTVRLILRSPDAASQNTGLLKELLAVSHPTHDTVTDAAEPRPDADDDR